MQGVAGGASAGDGGWGQSFSLGRWGVLKICCTFEYSCHHLNMVKMVNFMCFYHNVLG